MLNPKLDHKIAHIVLSSKTKLGLLYASYSDLTPPRVFSTFFQIFKNYTLSYIVFCFFDSDIHHICDLLWRNREQVARRMFLILPVQHFMTNIGPTLRIQPHIKLIIRTSSITKTQ